MLRALLVCGCARKFSNYYTRALLIKIPALPKRHQARNVMILRAYVSHPNSSWTPGVFYTYF